MTLSDAEAFLAAQRRKRRRDLLVPLAVLGAGALVALGFYVRRVRTVWFKAPDHAVVLHLADRDPIPLGPDMMFGARLRPGTYKLTVEGAPDALTEVRVPYSFNTTMAVPLTSDQCFVIANAAGLYALKGTHASGDLWIARITKSGEAATLPLFPVSWRDFEMDMCQLPPGKDLLDSVYVVEMVSCRERLTAATAQLVLLERYALCSR